MSSSVKMIPKWFKELREMSEGERRQIVEIVLASVSCHGSLKNEPTEIGKQMVSWIKREFELIGFAPNTTYLKAQGKKSELDATWVHPWGMVTLIYKNKTLPFLIYVNAGMRKDEMLLKQIPFNSDSFGNEAVKGLTS